MSETKYTPGPWHRNIPPARKYTTVWAGRNMHVAHVVGNGFSDEEVEANLKLIAAAPELLSVVESIIATVDIACLVENDSPHHVFRDVLLAAFKAREKALGTNGA